MNIEQFSFETQTEELQIENLSVPISVSIFKPEITQSTNVILTPTAVKNLVNQNVTVYLQHGFANNNPFSDADYADAGAEFVEQFADLALLSKVLVKYDAFTEDQLLLTQREKILFTIELPKQFNTEYISVLNERKHTSFAAELIKSDSDSLMIDKIFKDSLSDVGLQMAISGFIAPMLETFVFSHNIPFAIQRNPSVMSGIFTHDFWLCSKAIADKLQMPFRDLLSLCWDLN